MEQFIEGLDYYFNEKGKMVLTGYYLKKRGYCCGNGCLHCPYNYENVPEPGKTILNKKRLDNKQIDD